MTHRDEPRVAVVGGGPAGLMAAEQLRAEGIAVDLYEGKGSVGRKFLIAGKGGLNLTHSEGSEAFVGRFRGRRDAVAAWLRDFDADALRAWARGLGVETFVGSSGRVFPTDMKAAPLLRGWVRRLREQGVAFHVHHRCLGWSDDGALRFATPDGEIRVRPAATVLALGGGSWPQLGSDGAWTDWLAAAGADIAPLVPANCGFDVGWSEHLTTRFAGHPLKPVAIEWEESPGRVARRQGECVLTATGLEGSLIYALSAALREQIETQGKAVIRMDLQPSRDRASLRDRLAKPRGRRSLGEHLRRRAGLDAAKVALLFECTSPAERDDPSALAAAIKALPITLGAPRPVAEAISSAGGVRLEALDGQLMLRARAGVFCAGEMLDWEAPTGGYLLTASFASGLRAGRAAAAWLRETRSSSQN